MNVSCEMPKYVCHKTVRALKIKQLSKASRTDGSIQTIIYPEDEGFAPFELEASYVAKHNPQKGGYYVVYEDGYKSYSPAAAFKNGYTRV